MLCCVFCSCPWLSPCPLRRAQTEPLSVEELVTEANFYLSRGSCELAQLRFQQALEREPANTAAAIGKGDALVCQGAYDLGIQEYQNVISSDPNSVRAYNQLAIAYQKQYVSDSQRYPNRLVDALQAITTAERLGSNPDVANTKGVILYQSGDYAGAQTAFQNAISGASEDTYSAADRAAMQISLGKTYRQLGQLQEAETAFKRAVTLNPTSAQAHNELGDTYFRLENCEDAEFELTQATSLDPNNLSAAANLGIAAFRVRRRWGFCAPLGTGHQTERRQLAPALHLLGARLSSAGTRRGRGAPGTTGRAPAARDRRRLLLAWTGL